MVFYKWFEVSGIDIANLSCAYVARMFFNSVPLTHVARCSMHATPV